jgi:hypothetical protein
MQAQYGQQAGYDGGYIYSQQQQPAYQPQQQQAPAPRFSPQQGRTAMDAGSGSYGAQAGAQQYGGVPGAAVQPAHAPRVRCLEV